METRIMPNTELTAQEMCKLFRTCSPEVLEAMEKYCRLGFFGKGDYMGYRFSGNEFESTERLKVRQVICDNICLKTNDGEFNAHIRIINTLDEKWQWGEPIYRIVNIELSNQALPGNIYQLEGRN